MAKLQTMTVWVDGVEMVINAKDYDPSLHSITKPRRKQKVRNDRTTND